MNRHMDIRENMFNEMTHDRFHSSLSRHLHISYLKFKHIFEAFYKIKVPPSISIAVIRFGTSDHTINSNQ